MGLLDPPGLPRATAESRYGVAANATVFLGDSITIASDDPTNNKRGGAWPVYASILSGQRIYYVWNAGVSGNRTDDMIARFSTDVTPYAPKIVTLMAGTNDTGQSVALSTISANITTLVGMIRAIGAMPVLLTIPPNNSGFPTDRKERITALNAWIRRYCALQGITCIDTFALLSDSTTGLYVTAYNSDNTHPTGLGYKDIGSLVSTTLSSMLPNIAPPVAMSQNGDGNQLVTGGLFLSDGNSDGIPDNWSQSSSVSGVSNSIVSGDTSIRGNWWQITASTAASAWIGLQNVSSMTAAHRYLFTGRISTTTTAGSVTVLLRPKNSGGASLGDVFPVSFLTQAISGGVFAMEFVAPTGTVSGQIQFQVASGTTSVFKLAQVSLYDLTAMGVV